MPAASICFGCVGLKAFAARAVAGERLAEIRRSPAMFGLRLPKLGDGRDDLSGYSQAPDTLVPGGLVGYQPEEWCQRPGPPTSAGAEELQDRLDVAAQIATRDGAPGP